MSNPQEYQVTARKWRPFEFSSVVGQEHITTTLRNAIRQGRLHHAYLFSGPRGVGKTSTARILARALNCQALTDECEPCGECPSCREITEGRSMDVVEIDGASNNSVEDIRRLRDSAKYPPVSGRYKLYVIDEVHMLSTSAFNALLKTLEEPPRHLMFIFATTEPHKVPATILSRCQRFDFRRMQVADIVTHLAYIAEQEGYHVDEDALVVIARRGDGSMRDSQSIFDQVISFCGDPVTFEQANEALNIIDQGFFFRVTDMMRSSDSAEAFSIIEEIMRAGYDAQEFLIGLAEHLRNFLTILTIGSTRLIETAKIYLDRYAADAVGMERGNLIRALHLVMGARNALRGAPQPRLRLELTLVQLAVMDSTVDLRELLARIDTLPAGTTTAATATPSQPVMSTVVPPGGADPVRSGRARTPRSTPPTPSDASATGGGEPRTPGAAAMRDTLADFPTSSPPRRVGGSSDPTAQIIASSGTTGETATMIDVPASPQDAITLAELKGKWSDFVRFCREEKPALAMTLNSIAPAEVHGQVMRLYVPNETDVAVINRNRQLLADKLTIFFRTPLVVEGVVGVPPTPLTEQATDRSDDRQDDHPFIRAIVEHLGATRI